MSKDADIAKELAKEAERIEREDDREEPNRRYARIRSSAEPSQVYSIRIPVDRLEELRLVAHERGVAPSALMREWVLERLDDDAFTRTADPQVVDLSKALKRALDEALPRIVRSATEKDTKRTSAKRARRRSAS